MVGPRFGVALLGLARAEQRPRDELARRPHASEAEAQVMVRVVHFGAHARLRVVDYPSHKGGVAVLSTLAEPRLPCPDLP